MRTCVGKAPACSTSMIAGVPGMTRAARRAAATSSSTDQACAEPRRGRDVVILRLNATDRVPDRLAPRIAAPLPSQDLSTALVPAASSWR